MLNCLYKGESISSLIVREEKDYTRRKELSLELREASRKGLLHCEDCGQPLQFRHGEIRLPYFAHQDGFAHECDYEQSFKNESKAHRLGKEILYYYFKELYPESNVRLDFKLENKRRANVYVTQDSKRLAVEIERFDIDIEEWSQKHKDYQKLGVSDLWIICPNQNRTKLYENERDLHIFKQVLIHELSDMLLFLDVVSKEIHILKNIEYRNELGELLKDKIYVRKYRLQDIIITLEAKIEFVAEEPFFINYEKAKEAFIVDCKAEEKRAREAEEKRLAEEQRRMQEQRLRELEEDREDSNHLYRRTSGVKESDNSIEAILARKRAENRFAGQQPVNQKKNSKYETEYNQPSENELIKKYEFRIQRAKAGDNYSFNYLVQGLHNSPKTFNMIKTLFKRLIDEGDIKAKELYIKIMNRAGFPID